jgi:hypothetical protein
MKYPQLEQIFFVFKFKISYMNYTYLFILIVNYLINENN